MNARTSLLTVTLTLSLIVPAAAGAQIPRDSSPTVTQQPKVAPAHPQGELLRKLGPRLQRLGLRAGRGVAQGRQGDHGGREQPRHDRARRVQRLGRLRARRLVAEGRPGDRRRRDDTHCELLHRRCAAPRALLIRVVLRPRLTIDLLIEHKGPTAALTPAPGAHTEESAGQERMPSLLPGSRSTGLSGVYASVIWGPRPPGGWLQFLGFMRLCATWSDPARRLIMARNDGVPVRIRASAPYENPATAGFSTRSLAHTLDASSLVMEARRRRGVVNRRCCGGRKYLSGAGSA